MFTSKDLPEGWEYKPRPIREALWDFFDKTDNTFVRWCVIYENHHDLHQIEYYTPARRWVVHTPYSEGLTHEEAVNLVVTLIRLGEAERLVNEP